MIRLKKLVIAIGLLILCGIFAIVITGQEETVCDVDTGEIVEIVQTVCTGVGRDEVCYGNFEVNVIAREAENEDELDFSVPGDLASLQDIRSLYLSALDPNEDTWGIAQMRLLASTSRGTQDITLLLFGDVSLDNSVEPTVTFEIEVGRFPANIRNTPSANSLVLGSVPARTRLEAVGRLSDESWIRVRIPNGGVGWVSTQLINVPDEDHSIQDLAIQDAAAPYFGPMQAFYFSNGSGSACSNLVSDGLLIQTPEGVARVTLLINEVSIELVSSGSGSTAFLQANAEDGMTVSLIDGSAYVGSGGTTYFVDASNQTTIPLGENLSPIGTPSIPAPYDTDEMLQLPLLSVIRNPDEPISPSAPVITNPDTGGGTTTGSTSGTTTGTTSGSTTGTTSGSTTGTTSGSTTGTGPAPTPTKTNNSTGNATGSTGNATGNANGQGN